MEKNDQAARLMLNNQWKKALSLLEESYDAKPVDPWTMTIMGTCYFAMGDYTSAIQLCEKALPLIEEPSGPLFILGNAYCSVGRYADGKKAYQKAVASNPVDPNNVHIKKLIAAIP